MAKAPISLAIVVAAALAAGTVAPTYAQTTEPPPCPDPDELITTHPPDYLRVGSALAFTIERDSTTAVTEVAVTSPGPSGTQNELLTFPEGERRLRIIRPAPTGRRRFDLTFAWQQNAGKPNSCAGSDTYRGIPIVAKNATVGRSNIPRLSGHYRANYLRDEAARWILRPRCDVFGCKTLLRSSGGLRGTLVPQDDGRYELNRRQRAGSCQVGFVDGTTRTYGIYLHTRLWLTVSRRSAPDDIGLQLDGRRTSWYDAPADDFNLCNIAAKREAGRVRARRSGA